MKLLLLGPASPYRGGIAAFNDALASVLSVRHRLTVWNYRRLYPALLFPGSNQLRPERDAPENGERLLDSLAIHRWYGYRARIRRERYDAVIAPYWHPFFAPLYFALRPANERFILIGHNVLPHEAIPFSKTLSIRLLKSADGLITLSRSELQQARALGFAGRGAWHPSPVYPDYLARFRQYYEPYPVPFPSAQPTILFFGIIREYKGLGVLLEAMHDERLRNVNLLIAGECYRDAERWSARINELGTRVHWIDTYLPDAEVPRLFAAAQLVVLPYLRATSTGVLPLAYAAGLPAVVTSAGGLPDLVEDGASGAVVPPGDAYALAAAIAAWLRDEKLRAKAREAIPRLLQTMTFEALAETLEREVL